MDCRLVSRPADFAARALFVGLVACVGLAPRTSRAERFALLVDGGNSADSNHYSFYKDIHTLRGQMSPSWRISEETASGDGVSLGMDEPNAVDWDQNGNDTNKLDASGKFVLKTMVEPGARPANELELRAWIENVVKRSKKGDTILLYFTDHGGVAGTVGDVDENTICLYERCMKVREYRELLKLIPTDRKVVAIHDHCYSAGALSALFDASGPSGTPVPNRCGFAASNADEVSRFDTYTPKLAQSEKRALAARHLEVVSDTSLIQLPEASSDVFLENYLARRKPTPAEVLAACQPPALSPPLHLGMLSAAQRALVRERARQLETLAATSELKTIELEAKLAELQQKIKDAYRADNDAMVARRKALVAYAKLKIPQEWAAHVKASDQIDRYEAAGMTEAAEQLRLETMPNTNAVNRLTKALDKNPDFKAWLATSGAAAGLDPQCYAKEDAASNAIDALTQEAIPYRRAAFGRHGLAALHALFSKGTVDERQQFLGLINCENTEL